MSAGVRPVTGWVHSGASRSIGSSTNSRRCMRGWGECQAIAGGCKGHIDCCIAIGYEVYVDESVGIASVGFSVRCRRYIALD